MRKNIYVIILALFTATAGMAQQTGYYNGTGGKNGEQLKTALNDIIKGHTLYQYRFAKEIFKLADRDPLNPSNVIQVYTGFSHANNDYGNSGLQLNREHVWAKSHGDFTDIPPMYGDVHNLKPSASSVNMDKSNLDFDNGGVQHDIATGCYFTDSTWEARDEVKGDIARIIFYMATRYEGNDGESDLEVVDHNNTYPLPEHGKLSTLLQWNEQDPPDEFERNRNNVIESFQKNRNPFIDDPNFANLIWGGAITGPITVEQVQMMPETAAANQPVSITATITSTSEPVSEGQLFWGTSYDALYNEVDMVADGDEYSAQIPGQAEGVTIYYQVVGIYDFTIGSSVIYNYYVPEIFTGTLTSIYDIQGQQDDSPYEGQVVSTSGVVTGNYGDHYYIQDGDGEWNGLFIYELGRNPLIGDSVIITGKISEYYGKTEMSIISGFYSISSGNPLPEPVTVQTGDVEEAHESILVKVNSAMCTDENFEGNFGMWEVNDGSGELKILNTSVFEYNPTEGLYYTITGPMNYDFDEWKIDLRDGGDVTEGGDTEGPSVVEVTPVISTNLKVKFNEAVETTSAENTANYSINNGVTVESALQHIADKSLVHLTVTTLDGDYELTIQNVEDNFGNVMEVQTISFSFVGIEEQLVNGEIKVYPNPASEQLNVSFVAIENFEVEVSLTDIAGKQLLHENYDAKQGINKLACDLNKFGKGIYFLNLKTEKGTLNYKVLVK